MKMVTIWRLIQQNNKKKLFSMYEGQKGHNRNVLKALDHEMETASRVFVMSEDSSVRDDGRLQRAWPGEGGT